MLLQVLPAQLLYLPKVSPSPAAWLIIGTGVNFIDMTSAEMIEDESDRLQAKGAFRKHPDRGLPKGQISAGLVNSYTQVFE